MRDDSVRSVKRAFSVLKCFTVNGSSLHLSAVAEAVGLSTSTAQRLLSTLVALGVLKRNPDRSYSVGSEAYLIGAVAHAHFKPQRVARPYMKALRDQTKEAVSLYGLEEDRCVCYEHIPSLLTMRHVVRVGERFPLWGDASGRVLLAYEDAYVIEREAKTRLKEAVLGPGGEKFLADLAAIRQRDYAMDLGECGEEVVSLAVPIFNQQRKSPFCLSVTAPKSRFDERDALDLIPELQKICASIATQLFVF